MKIRVRCLVMALAVLSSGVALAQDSELPLKNWTAPPYWTPPRAAGQAAPDDQMQASAEGMTASAQALPSSPVPFVAIAPCRIVDTRVPTSDGFHEPNFADGETRTFAFPSSTDCPGLPATSVAYSLNVQYRPLSVLAFITLFPTGTTMPTVSTLTAGPAAWVEDAAIIPAGTSGAVDVYCQYAGRVVIDVNGYYAAQSLVSSLNTLTGDVTLAAGSNIAITPGANTLTIAMTGVPGGTLPAGVTGQTLRSNGSAWLATSSLYNDGTNIGIGTTTPAYRLDVNGMMNMPATTATSGTPTAGVLLLGGNPFLHSYAGPASDGGNTFLGVGAGNFTLGGVRGWEGSYNTATGYQSLISNTTGYDNTASGYQSLYSNAAGAYNTANGAFSLSSNTTGTENTASGQQSLHSNTTASKNTAVGFEALFTQSYSNSNTPWDSLNTAVGYQALYSNQPDNTGHGYLNTAVGSQALQANTTGLYNTANGHQSLYSNTTGRANTAGGVYSLYSNTTGDNNTASGYNSLYFNTEGNYNTANGISSLFNNITGSLNTASGYVAGQTNKSGTNNTFLGAFSDAAADNLTNATAIGYGAIVDVSDHVRIGNGSVTQISGQVAWSNPSDERLKDNIRDLDLGLDFVLALRPVSFTMKTGDGRTDMGFLAQDVEAALGDGYSVLGIGADKDRTLSLRYTDLIAPMVKAVQEQQTSIDAKDARIAALENQQTAQQAEIEALKSATAQRDRVLERRLAALEQGRR